MKWNLVYTLLCFYSVFLSSCSIEKRLYMGGYHIEYSWRSQKDNKLLASGSFEMSRPNGAVLSDTAIVEKHAFEIDTAQSRSSMLPLEIQSTVIRPQENNQGITDTVAENVVMEGEQIDQRIAHVADPEKKYLEALGFFSFLIAVIGFFTPIGAFFFFIAAIIAAIASQKKFRKNPGKYMGAGFGILGLILGVLGLITILWILFAVGLFAA